MNDERFNRFFDDDGMVEKLNNTPVQSWQDKRAALMAGRYSKGESRTARRKQERKEAKIRKKAASTTPP